MSAQFPETRWSLILEHQEETLCPEQRGKALDELCEIYWNPVHAFFSVICPGRSDIDDLTQGFFTNVVVKQDIFAHARPGKGKLRSYLQGAARNHYLNTLRREHTLRRGGPHLETRVYNDSEPVENDPFPAADQAFDRHWARNLITICLDRLDRDFREKGKEDLCLALRPLLIDDSTEARLEAAAKLGLTDTALRVCLHRFIARFREIFREEVQATLFPGASLEEEMQWIHEVLHSP